MSKLVALIQGRMGSARFPGKMLKELGGFPILEWVLRRTGQAHLVDKVVLATTDLKQDDLLVALAKKLGFEAFRGSELDVLDRFAAAADHYKADDILRICADNPFICPTEIDRLVMYYKGTPCDYACNHQDRMGSGYADGFGAEILSNKLLQKLASSVTDMRHREHVTQFLWDHPKCYRLHAVPSPNELAFPKLRFDVDVPQDLNYLRQLVHAGIGLDSRANTIVEIAQQEPSRTDACFEE